MLFYSRRSLNIGIRIGGQRMVVMFDDSNQNGVCVFAAKRKDVAEAIVRHPYFKKGVIWSDEEPSASAEASGSTALDMAVASAGEPLNTKKTAPETAAQDRGTEADASGTSAAQNEAQNEGKKEFANFTEAKEWFCKTFGVSKTSVRNPDALKTAALEKGVEIVF